MEDKVMEERVANNNEAVISGEIVSDFTFSHESFGEKFYTADLSVERNSGTEDIIPIMVSDRLVDMKEDWVGKFVNIVGQFRSYNKHSDSENHLILFVFAREFEYLNEDDSTAYQKDENHIFLDGFICKKPTYRETPLGRKISDVILAVNRPYGKSDYIPCIFWGRNAVFAGSLEVGTHISLEGRIQSREYQKRISDNEYEARVAYEVSAKKVETVGREEV